MSKYDPPAQFDPALFWGLALVIFFCFHKSRKGKKEKGGHAAWQNLFKNWHDLFSFFLRGFYEKYTCKTASAYPLGTPLLSEESAVFKAHICDPRRRPGSSFAALLHVQNIWQPWTPACAGDHTEYCTSLSILCDLCAKYFVHAEAAECAGGYPGLPINFLKTLPFLKLTTLATHLHFIAFTSPPCKSPLQTRG
jgi:hypothetical protein